eukprot:1326811-Amphidinium_carterae.1
MASRGSNAPSKAVWRAKTNATNHNIAETQLGLRTKHLTLHAATYSDGEFSTKTSPTTLTQVAATGQPLHLPYCMAMEHTNLNGTCFGSPAPSPQLFLPQH